jgi:sugar lactone lactonase YvrE
MVLETFNRTLAVLLILIGLIVPSAFTRSASTATETRSAVEQLQSLQAKLTESHRANDWHSNLVAANALKELLNEAPDSLLEVAQADVKVGDVNAALRELDQFGRMGQSIDLVAASSEFAALVKDSRFATIQSAMDANRRPVSFGSTAFELSDSSLLAEDADYDSNSQRFFVTSVREKKIISVNVSGASVDFAKAPDGWSMLAVKVDASRRLLWATEVAMRGFVFAAEPDWGRSAVLCFDLKSGKLLQRVEGPRGAALGDMALMENGDVIVSDGDGGGVYRLPTKGTALERLDGGDFISPQTPAMHPDGKHVFVPDYVRGIGVLEIATKRVRWLSMEKQFALNGIDGLYFADGELIAVQNGTSPERVVVFTLDKTLTTIESQTIIERSTSTLGDPTHGVVIGKEFYYIANSGWDVIDDHGNMKPGAKLSRPRIMRAPLISSRKN